MRPRDEHGGVTLFAVACLGTLLLVGAALGVVAAMLVAHRSAQAAADLAALAAAASLADGADGCSAARTIAAANGGDLERCTVTGREVTVTVRVPGPRWLGQSADLRGRARAGPA